MTCETKTCRICTEELPLGCFYVNGTRIRTECKECTKKDRKQKYELNRDDFLERKRGYYRKNPKITNERNRRYYKKNREKMLAANKRYVKNNRDRVREANREKNKRYRKDPVYAFSWRVRRHARMFLKGEGEGVFRYLPYTRQELYDRLVSTLPSGYTEKDIADGSKLHIDHIRPVSSFNLTGKVDDEFLACWSLDNLQLLPAKENIRKGDSLDWQPPLEKGEQLGWRWIA